MKRKHKLKKIFIIILLIMVLIFSTLPKIKWEFHQKQKSKPKTQPEKMKPVDTENFRDELTKSKLYVHKKELNRAVEKRKQEQKKKEGQEKRTGQKEEEKPYEIKTVVITAYTDSGGSGLGVTANGEKPVAGRTLAGPPEYNFGTIVEIPGVGKRVIVDRGGAIKGNVFDLYMNSEREALAWGRKTMKVKIYKNRTER